MYNWMLNSAETENGSQQLNDTSCPSSIKSSNTSRIGTSCDGIHYCNKTIMKVMH